MQRDLLFAPKSTLAGGRSLDEATASAVRDFLSRLKGDRAPVDALGTAAARGVIIIPRAMST